MKPFYKYQVKNVVNSIKPIKVILCNEHQFEVNVNFWIQVRTQSFFWDFITFREVSIYNDLDKVLKDIKFRNVSLKEIDLLTEKVKKEEIDLKLHYIDIWYSVD